VTPPPTPGAATPSAQNQQLQRFTSASLQGYWPGFSTWLGLAQSSAGGTAKLATLSTGRGAFAATASRSFLNDFYSPEFYPTYGLISDRTRIQANLVVPKYTWMPSVMQLNLEQVQDDLADGGHNTRTTGRVSMNTRGYFISNSITWNRVDSAELNQNRRDGALLVSKNFNRFSLRGDVGYGLESGDRTLERLAMQTDTRFYFPWLLNGSVTRDLVAADTRYAISGVRKEGPVGLNVFANYSNTSRLTLGVGIYLSLGREPRTRRWVSAPGPMAGEGAVSGLAFLDSNGTGVREPGEPALEEVGLTVNGTPRGAYYPGDGAIFQPNIRPDVVTAVTLSEGTVEDPSLRPKLAGYRIVPRTGKTILLDFPLELSGELTGATQIQTALGPMDLGEVTLDILDADGKLLRQAVSGHDGYFDLTGLVTGTYTLRVAPAEAQRLDAILQPPRTFEITPKKNLYEGIQLMLAPRVPAPPEAGPEP
jgi:hypothetical protein